jgi:hypothetical protein
MNENNITEASELNSEEKVKPNFGIEIDRFIKHIEAQADIVPLVMGLLNVKLLQESRHVDKFIKDNSLQQDNQDEESKGNLLIPGDKIREFIELTEKVDTTTLANDLLPINFVVSFVSQYDAYLGGLIRTIFLTKPEFLNSSEKNILFSELIKFESIEEAREFIVEKEVESILRESHLKQFKWLENKLGITLRKDLPSFSEFIEITERRNLFVHCNGVISRQYLDVCKENDVKNIDKLKLGQKLIAKPTYFNKCYMVLFEIGFKLGQVIWRKLQPEDIENADKHLNNVCYQLLIKGHNKLALNLLTFGTDTLKKHYDQETVCILTINKALAHYLSDKKEECKKVLAKHDWSATSDKYKLATAVLEENYSKAIELMKSIGNSNSHVNKDAYKEWPLFRQFRKTNEFKAAYKTIFEEELIYVEPKPRELEDILTDLKQMRKEIEVEKTAANSV